MRRHAFAGDPGVLIEGEHLYLRVPRAVADGATTLIVDGYTEGFAIDAIQKDGVCCEAGTYMLEVIAWEMVRQGMVWAHCRLAGFDRWIDVRLDRVIAIVRPAGTT